MSTQEGFGGTAGTAGSWPSPVYPESSAPYKLVWSPGLLSTQGLCWHWLALGSPALPHPLPREPSSAPTSSATWDMSQKLLVPRMERKLPP